MAIFISYISAFSSFLRLFDVKMNHCLIDDDHECKWYMQYSVVRFVIIYLTVGLCRIEKSVSKDKDSLFELLDIIYYQTLHN